MRPNAEWRQLPGQHDHRDASGNLAGDNVQFNNVIGNGSVYGDGAENNNVLGNLSGNDVGGDNNTAIGTIVGNSIHSSNNTAIGVLGQRDQRRQQHRNRCAREFRERR
jgi:outer membrane lipoprotein SlyB